MVIHYSVSADIEKSSVVLLGTYLLAWRPKPRPMGQLNLFGEDERP